MNSIDLELTRISQEQHKSNASGYLKNVENRILILKKLKSAIQKYENEIIEALHTDLGKSKFESYTSEIGIVQHEITTTLKNIHQWSKTKSWLSPLLIFPSASQIHYQAYGKVLIIAPWNYPFQLLFNPLVSAIAAGNSVLLKPSELAPETSKISGKIIRETFPEEIVSLIEGDGSEIVPKCIEIYEPNLIFFTGSTMVGKKIAEIAAKSLTTCVLELGGKSPCIVDSLTDKETIVKRILLGKLLNSGQTCVAPDYLLIKPELKDAFIQEYITQIHAFFGKDAPLNPDYPKIINESHFNRILALIKDQKILHGGSSDNTSLKIEPTLIDLPDLDSEIMKNEIFGPILPILTYKNFEELESIILRNRNPLALYIFSKNQEFINQVTQRIPFGGGCINNTLMHLVDSKLPFGGIGNSGMGSYHGKHGFLTFSHQKSIVKSSFWMDLKQKYPPYKESSLWLIRKFLH